MRQRHLKRMFAKALAAALVISNLPSMQYVYSESVGVVRAYEGVDAAVDVAASAIEGSGVTLGATKNNTPLYTVGSDGTYSFTGSVSNIAIEVAKGVTATLILDNLTIDDSNLSDSKVDSIIKAKAGSSVTIDLVGDNVLKCNPDCEDFENAIKHAKYEDETVSGSTVTYPDDSGYLTIESSIGSGTLSLTGTYDDAVKYKGGSVNIKSGKMTIDDCHGDGIQAEVVNISGGTTNISTTYDEAATSFYGSSNKNDIKESGSTKTETVTYDTGSHKAIKAGTKEKTFTYTAVTDEDMTKLGYTAGTKYTQEASGGLYITGGTVNIDTTDAGLKANSVSSAGSYSRTSSGVYIIGSPDDGIQSNNDMEITGGTVNIAAGDDGIQSANNLTISDDAEVNITEAYEGIEGSNIVIGNSGSESGPRVVITSADDGINAAKKTATYVYADTDEANYTKTTVTQSNNSCTVYSGYVEINIDSENTKSTELSGTTVSYGSSGDGIDCNGSLNIQGGTVKIYGQSSGDNSPIDTDSGFTLSSKATVLAAGVDSMGETTPKSGDSVYVTYGGSNNMSSMGQNIGPMMNQQNTSDTRTEGTNTDKGIAGNVGSTSQGQNSEITVGTNNTNKPGFDNISGNNQQNNTQLSQNMMTPPDMSTNGQNMMTLPGMSSVSQSTEGTQSGIMPSIIGEMQQGQMASQALGSIAAGSVLKVYDGTTEVASENIKYAASYVFYASPLLSSEKSYTVSVVSDGTSQNTDTNTNSSSASGQTTESSSSVNTSGSTASSSSGSSSSSSSTGSSGSSGSSSSTGSSGSTSAKTTGTNTDSTDVTGTTSEKSTASDMVVTTASSVSKGDTVDATDTLGNKVSYRITGDASVSFGIEETVKSKITVPDTVNINGDTYKVTRIGASALKGNKDIKSVIIGENVRIIGAKAFANCENLKSVTIKGTGIKNVGKKAFKGIAKNATIKVSGTKQEYTKVKRLIKASGIARSIKVKKA